MIQVILSIIREVILGGIPNGLLPHKEDERDFKFSLLGGIFGGYKPKHDVLDIPTVSVKNQIPFSTCVWNSAVVQKEVDEGVPLSVKYLVTVGRKRGLAGWLGYATLRDAQKVLCENGICEERLLPDVKSGWTTYTDPSQLTYDIEINAATHKTKSYFAVTSKDEYLKALDEGRVIHTGCEWFTGYNSSGLPPSRILNPRSGISVGGHAFVCRGYDIPRGLLKFQNSYGPSWGDNSCFYVRFDDWFGGMAFTGYVSVDAPQDTLWKMYEGKDVKGAGPAIYRVENGQKRVFLNEATFFKYGGKFGQNKTWVQISDSLLKSIPTGNPMV